ncbi:esterase-like activity of phytase family protein [Sphingomonas jatrophae]|uniref:esterase-like activity of phytase family protein n=1 Tax=Sphingomonas jatrophae TaxID=1166337 RepID=UPI0013F4D209|nr:esterase-like activity of phytase family protein [Sphingomonas jatrophae]
MRALRLFPALAMLLATASVPFAAHDPHAPIRAWPVLLDLDRPALRTLGQLRFVRGWALASANASFGGISGLVAWRGRLMAVSDTGTAISFRLHDGQIVSPWIRPLPGLARRARKKYRDTESLTIDPATGRLWVATETNNEVWRFAADFARAEAVARPPAMHDWPDNGGAESMTRLPDGRFVVVAEHREGRRPRTAELLVFPGDPTAGVRPIRLDYRRPRGCVPSDAAALPDGRLLVLNRCFTLRHGFSAVLERVDLNQGRRSDLLVGEEIARFARPITLDNLEAVAVEAVPGGARLWIASDDNFSIAQRTLLLEFILPD